MGASLHVKQVGRPQAHLEKTFPLCELTHQEYTAEKWRNHEHSGYLTFQANEIWPN